MSEGNGRSRPDFEFYIPLTSPTERDLWQRIVDLLRRWPAHIVVGLATIAALCAMGRVVVQNPDGVWGGLFVSCLIVAFGVYLVERSRNDEDTITSFDVGQGIEGKPPEP